MARIRGTARADILAAARRLQAHPGIGPWTADIFLLFCLGHPDAWPVGDLALQEAARRVLKLRARPDAKKLEKIGADVRKALADPVVRDRIIERGAIPDPRGPKEFGEFVAAEIVKWGEIVKRANLKAD